MTFTRRLRVLGSLTGQACRTVSGNPVRSFLAALGVALGVAVLIASVGLAGTLNAQVNATFDELRATRILVQDNRSVVDDPLFDLDTVDTDLANLPGVVAGGFTSSSETSSSVVTALGRTSPPQTLSLVFATPGALLASGATVASGRLYDNTPAALGEPVVLLGSGAAESLQVTTVDGRASVLLGDRAVLIAGILEGSGSEPQLTQAVILDPRLAPDLGLTVPEVYSALIRTEPGFVASVARSVPLAIRPQDARSVGISYAPEPRNLRAGVQDSVNTLALAVAALAIFIGAVGIANSMISAVSQRVGEIGLRRSIGARPHHVLVQILAEGSFIGLGGALVGTLGGVGVLIVACAANGWQAVLPTWAWWCPAVGGFAVGALAGLFPALRASRLSPAVALRAS